MSKNQKYWSKLILVKSPKKKNLTKSPNPGVTSLMKTWKSTTSPETRGSMKILSKVSDFLIPVRITLFNKEKLPKSHKWTKTSFISFSKIQQESRGSWKRTNKLRTTSPKFKPTLMKPKKISSFSRTKSPKLKTKRISMNFSPSKKRSEKSRRKDNLSTTLVTSRIPSKKWKITMNLS